MRPRKPQVTLVEVGLRDGLQNEKKSISAAQKIEIALDLIQAGSRRIELGAFVRSDRVPQMSGTEIVIPAVLENAKNVKGLMPSVLVPNMIGLEKALESGISEVAVFGAATESFSKQNINCSIEESLERFREVIRESKKNKIRVRGYLSTCFGCPFEGAVDENKVVQLIQTYLKMGCYEVSIGDTIGVAHPGQVKSLIAKLKRKKVPLSRLAGHFHDTRGTALANILQAYQMGIRVFDSSLGGLGGCPYAPSATGNVATEDVVYMFDGMGVQSGLSLEKLLACHGKMTKIMGKELPSKVGHAGLPVPTPLGTT